MQPLGQLMLYIFAVVILIFAVLAFVTMVFVSTAKAFLIGRFNGITNIISAVFNYLSAVIAFLKSPLDSLRVKAVETGNAMVTSVAQYMGIVNQSTISRVDSILNTKLLIYPTGDTNELRKQNVRISDAVGGSNAKLIVQVLDAMDGYVLTGKKVDLATFGECFLNMVMRHCPDGHEEKCDNKDWSISDSMSVESC